MPRSKHRRKSGGKAIAHPGRSRVEALDLHRLMENMGADFAAYTDPVAFIARSIAAKHPDDPEMTEENAKRALKLLMVNGFIA